MSIVLKSASEIERMRRAGSIVAAVLAELRQLARPGVTTAELDRCATELIREAGGRPSFLGYRGFAAAICTSVNEEVLHGIPGRRVLREGDLLKIDIGVEYEGLHADAALTMVVGRGAAIAYRLVETAERAFWAGCSQARPGKRIGDIGAAIQSVVEGAGFSIIEGYTGHGIGRALHEEPAIPNSGEAGKGIPLRAGMTIAIEPMISAGSGETRLKRDGWTIVTRDRSLAAHYEHTVWVSDEGPVVLTLS